MAIAGSARAWWFGAGLVFLTSIARNYDQTWIGEAPVKWLIGNAAFSLGSGTFLFLCLRGFLRGRIPDPKLGLGLSWIQFMGLFWATAPVAWIYAIPVERFLGSLDAAYANIAMLAVVSLWRVLLMARVISVLHSVPYGCALALTLTAACIEVAVVGVLGGGFSRRIMAGMGGLRNSPEEDVMLAALSNAVGGAVLLFLPALITAFVSRGSRKFTADLVPGPGRVPWGGLALVALFWLAVAVPAQREVRRNAQLDTLVASARFRAALDHLSTHGPGAYAPSRVLAPKVYERSVFVELPGMWAVLTTNDPPWLHAHLLRRWEMTCQHFRYTPSTNGPHPLVDGSEIGFRDEMLLRQITAEEWMDVLQGLEQSDPGRRWLTDNAALFWRGYHVAEETARIRPGAANAAPLPDSLQKLFNRLKPYPEPQAPTEK